MAVQDTNLLFSIVFDRTEQIAAEQAQRQQIRITIGVLLLLLLSATMGVVFLVKFLKQTRAAESALRKHLRIRNALVLEIQHRTKNNMQVIAGLVGLQASFSASTEASDAYRRLNGRISTIALAHHRLIADSTVSYINLSTYIHDVVDGAMSSSAHSGARPRCFVDVSEIDVLFDLAVPCGLVVHELVVSGLRRIDRALSDQEHRIRIVMSELDLDTLELSYSDNIPAATQNAQGTHQEDELSTLVIREITEHQLQGQVSFTISPESGTHCLISISQRIYKDRVPYESFGS